MIEIWMENHSMSDNICNLCKFVMPNFFFTQGMTNNVRFTLSVSDTMRVVYN